ncbi:hypothetical protein ACFQX7_33030 [Luedemannella flava]
MFLTVGATPTTFRFGIAVNRNAGTAPYRGATPQPLVTSANRRQPAAPAAKPAAQVNRAGAASPGGTACATAAAATTCSRAG